MRGITTAVFFLVCITVVLSAPNSNSWKNKNLAKVAGDVEIEESIYPSDRTRPSTPRRGGSTTQANNPTPSGGNQGQGPYLFFREPKAIGTSGPNNWPKYRITQRGRDDDESEEEEEDHDEDDVEDDVGDDDDGGSDEDYAFDTPSWDDVYPPDETGPYARKNQPISSSYPQIQAQQINTVDGSYGLQDGSPGTSSYKGRSGFRNWGRGQPRPYWVSEGRSQRTSQQKPRQVRRQEGPPAFYIRVPANQNQQQQQWYNTPRRPSSSSRWSNSGPGPMFYQQSSRPHRRSSWNWRPTPQYYQQKQQILESDEVDSGEAHQFWSGPPGPRHIVKNWSRPKPSSSTWNRRSSVSPKFGYY